MAKIRVLLVDDHALVREAVRLVLQATEGIEVVGEAQQGSQVLPLVRQLAPDLVLLDPGMPGLDGLNCLQLIRDRHPEVKVVMLSGSTEPTQIETAFRRGASGYIVKTIHPGDLASAIRLIVEGTVYQPSGLPENHAGPAHGLTGRELEILPLVARGLPNRQIGQQLFLTEQTVKFHLTNIYRKLSVSNRSEAARYAYTHGLVNSPHLGSG